MTRPVARGTFRRSCRTCGWTGTYDTAARGDYAKRRHSCEKKQHDDATTARGDVIRQRINNLDRTPKPCHHKKANHQHGTNAAYVLDKCRCLPCAAARKEQDNWRRRQQAYGRYDRYVPADPVREHVQALRDAGMGLKTIAKRSGVAHGALWKLVYGKKRPDGSQTPSRRVLRETADKIHALDPTSTGPLQLADGAILDQQASTAASRKLQALVALGWSMSALGQRVGVTQVRNFIPIVKGERRLTVATARKADELFDELCMTLPTAETRFQQAAITRSLNYAWTYGWVPPLALEDLPDTDADESLLDIDEVAIQRRMGGDRAVPLSKAEKAELVRRWMASGRSLNECERVTGITRIQRYVTREAS